MVSSTKATLDCGTKDFVYIISSMGLITSFPLAYLGLNLIKRSIQEVQNHKKPLPIRACKLLTDITIGVSFIIPTAICVAGIFYGTFFKQAECTQLSVK